MKLGVQDTPFEISGLDGAKVSKFRVAAHGKAFQILSSTMYRNKIQTVIREISCNGLDGHRAVGKLDVPLRVHLPNTFNPFFSVRDFGCSLTDEQMMELYTTYFESTKSNSNDDIGGFGLGCKSPFSYTTSFTVITYLDGKKTTFKAFVDQSFLPSMMKVMKEDTDEENGVEVIIPVKETDFYRFKEEAVTVYRWFDVKPITDVELTYPEPAKVLFEEGGLKLHDQTRHLYNPLIRVMQGPVAYMVDFSAMGSDFKCKFRTMYHLELPIGAVEIAPSREDLSYIPETIEVIKAATKRLDDLMTTKINDDIAAMETYTAACRYFYMDLNLQVILEDSSEIKWKGRTINKMISVSHLRSREFRIFEANDSSTSMVGVKTIDMTADPVIYVDDLKPSDSRARLLEVDEYAILIRDSKGIGFRSLLKLMHQVGMTSLSQVKLASTLPEATTKPKRARSTYPTLWGMYFNHIYGDRWKLTDDFDESEINVMIADEVSIRDQNATIDGVIYNFNDLGKMSLNVGINFAVIEAKKALRFKKNFESDDNDNGVVHDAKVLIHNEIDNLLNKLPQKVYSIDRNHAQLTMLETLVNHFPIKANSGLKSDALDNLIDMINNLDHNVAELYQEIKELLDPTASLYNYPIPKDLVDRFQTIQRIEFSDIWSLFLEEFPLVGIHAIENHADDVELYIRSKLA